jgi:hypothetical protein
MQIPGLSAPQTAVIVLVLESALIFTLLMGWLFGARRLNLTIHHRVVYSVVLIHLVSVGSWMIPRGILILPSLLGNPVAFLPQLVHDTLGFLAVILSILLVVIFAFYRNLQLGILRKARPIMILTLILWMLVFALGLVAFTQIYL